MDKKRVFTLLPLLLALNALFLALSPPLYADEVFFKNGDRLSGKVTRLEGGKLTIQSDVAGELAIDMKNVRTFSTDEPIEIHFRDGTVVKQKVFASEGAIFTIGRGEVLVPQRFAVSDVVAINPPKARWKGDITAGFTVTRGNSETETANVSINLLRRAERDRITANAAYFYGRQEDPDTGDKTTTQDEWLVALKYDYFIAKQFYSYANTRVERDEVADLDLRLIAGLGVGYQWIETADFNLSTEGGLAWLYEDFSDGEETDDQIAGRFAYHIDKSFLNQRIKLFHDFEILPSLENFPDDFFLTTQAGVRVPFTKVLFGEVKVILDHDATPASGAEKTDTKYITGVGLSF